MSRKVDFLLEYEVKNREFESLCLLAAYLESKGYSVGFVNSWQSLYEKPEKYKAKVMVLSACYDDGTYDYFTQLAASFDKVVNMQWEQVLANYHYHRDLPYKTRTYEGIALHIRHVCWGERERQWLIQRFGVDPGCTRVVGCIPLDFYRPELRSHFIPREELFRKYGLDSEKKTLLFISSFASIGLPETEGHGDETLFRLIAEASERSQKEVLRWFDKIMAQHPDIQLIYRYHPAEKGNPTIEKMAHTHKSFYTITQEAIGNWLAACDIIYSWSSTSLVEMLETGRDVYILRPYEIPEMWDMPVYDGATFLDTYEAFAATLDGPMKALPAKIENVRRWYDVQAEPAYVRLGNWLIETYHDETYHSRPAVTKRLKVRIREALKKMPGFVPLAKAACSVLGENRIASKLALMREEAEYSVFYKEQMKNREGYIHERYEINRSTPEEQAAAIARWRALIDPPAPGKG